ncbi:MAG TPA: peptide chain release factor N(5)-glutamine methyltransferase [Acidimicrobiales bacterium]
MTAVNSYLVTELIGAGLNRREARWLVEEYMPDGDREAITALRQAAQRRLNGEPLQYIFGHWPFRSLDLDVDPRVLIPRPESEELVGVALAELAASATTAPVILDLGCGSGAIGLALLHELNVRGVGASVICVDESSDALVVAKRNAQKHELTAVSFVHSSWFDGLDLSLRGRIDLIVANPPYIGAEQFATLDPVLAYEPIGALVAPDASGVSGFSDIEEIVGGAAPWLVENGLLICEHGDMHRIAAMDSARDAGFGEVRDRDDMFGNPRFLVARR